ncbi:hypothetical protein [Dactylosporangium sp. CS-033363]|uniref:hypothetical protein n=1 Tax=Dactylosporangium sp. CS-033363 TaxID=3239935 RepID=UPI003D945AE8
MSKPSPATIAAHQAAIADLTAAATTTDLAAQIATWYDLRDPNHPGVAPGVSADAPDGKYFNGFHFFTKAGAELAASEIRQLPMATIELWTELDVERRVDADRRRLLADDDADRRGGRPAVGRPVAVRLPNWYIDALDREAEDEGTTRPEYMRTLITEARAARAARNARRTQ